VRVLGCELKFIEVKNIRYKIENTKWASRRRVSEGVELDGVFIYVCMYVHTYIGREGIVG
jgi:hypothetical protein